MKKVLLSGLIAGTAAVFVFSFVPVAVWAQAEDDKGEAVTTTATEVDEDTSGSENEAEDASGDDSLKTRIQALKQQRQENKQQRLEANKLKACENRKAHVAAIMTRSINRAENQIQLFTTISERVKAFYVKKGRTVANYDQLVAAMDTAKTKAQTDLETLKSADAFECSADDPKGDIEAFKLALKTVNQDLKDYRTSVKNLIVGVKSAQSTAAKEQEGSEQ